MFFLLYSKRTLAVLPVEEGFLHPDEVALQHHLPLAGVLLVVEIGDKIQNHGLPFEPDSAMQKTHE